MRFKTIIAANMEAAMSELRETMGTDAIILDTQHGPDGKVTLRAAIERVAPARDEADNADRAPRPERPASRPRPSCSPGTDGLIGEIEDALVFHGVPQKLLSSLTRTAAAFAAEDAVVALSAAFESHYGFAPLAAAPTRPVMLIGPAGAGKTITAAKLAARALLSGKETMLIAADSVRTGATAQLNEMTKIMQCELHEASDASELARLLHTRAPGTSCFIDTPAASPFNLTELKTLKELVMAADVDPVLVLPAGGDAAEAAEIVDIFSGFGARGVIVTRLDSTRRLGSILTAMETAAMTLHHVSVTPYIAKGLAPISPGALARIFLQDPFERETYQELEQASS